MPTEPAELSSPMKAGKWAQAASCRSERLLVAERHVFRVGGVPDGVLGARLWESRG